MPDRMYLVTVPFPGHIETTAYKRDGVWYAEYSGALYNNNQGDLVVADYIENKDYYLELISDDELDVLLTEYFDACVSEPEEITHERYFEMLEVLPPCKWRRGLFGESFHISERITGNLVNWYVKHRSFGVCTYYTFIDYDTLSASDVESKVLNHRTLQTA